MRRPFALMAALGLMPALATVPTSAAAVSIYHGKSPYTAVNGVTCGQTASKVSAAEIVVGGEDGWLVEGMVHVWRSSRCNTVWASVTFPGGVDAGEWGIAYIETHYGTRNCDSPNGTPHPGPGQTFCRTAMLDYVDFANDAQAVGYVYSKSPSGQWEVEAWGRATYPEPEF